MVQALLWNTTSASWSATTVVSNLTLPCCFLFISSRTDIWMTGAAYVTKHLAKGEIYVVTSSLNISSSSFRATSAQIGELSQGGKIYTPTSWNTMAWSRVKSVVQGSVK